MKSSSLFSYIIGSSLLIAPVIATEYADTASLIDFSRTNQEQIGTGFNLLSLDLATLSDGMQPFQELITDILTIDADVVTLQGVMAGDEARALHEQLEERYAYFYIEVNVSRGIFIASRYSIDDECFNPFFIGQERSVEDLFSFFQQPIQCEELVPDQYVMYTALPPEQLPYPGVLASIMRKGLGDPKNLFWDGAMLLSKAPEQIDWQGYGRMDKEGNAAVGAQVSASGETDGGGKYSAGAKAEVRQDNRGNVSAEGEVFVKGTFR